MILPAGASLPERKSASRSPAAKAAGASKRARRETFGTLVSTINESPAASDAEKALNHHAEGEPFDHAKHAREHIFSALATVRESGDKLEAIVADDLWPLPTYREMLFIK